MPPVAAVRAYIAPGPGSGGGAGTGARGATPPSSLPSRRRCSSPRWCIATVEGHIPSRRCCGLDARSKPLGTSEGVFEYREGGGFRDQIPAVHFNGRGKGVKPGENTHHKGGGHSASIGVVELMRANLLVNLSKHINVDTPRNLRTLRLSSMQTKAARRSQRRRRCRCFRNCTLTCGCQSNCFLPPPLFASNRWDSCC